ncbi:MAG: pirin-like C-terminal cupin domain-containing protein, partial [Propionivibrio sp.]
DGTAGAVQRPDTEPLYLDVHLPAGSRFVQPIPAGHNAFTYTYRGRVRVGTPGVEVPDRHMGLLANDGADGVIVEAVEEARCLIIAGQPLHEPIAQHGPFVMNTGEELNQAVRDYQTGLFDRATVQAL